MSILLACGPILEPLIAIFLTSIISIIIFIYIIKKIIKSEFYKTDYLIASPIKKAVYVLLLFIIIISVLIIAFYVIFFLIAGILLT